MHTRVTVISKHNNNAAYNSFRNHIGMPVVWPMLLINVKEALIMDPRRIRNLSTLSYV